MFGDLRNWLNFHSWHVFELICFFFAIFLRFFTISVFSCIFSSFISIFFSFVCRFLRLIRLIWILSSDWHPNVSISNSSISNEHSGFRSLSFYVCFFFRSEKLLLKFRNAHDYQNCEQVLAKNVKKITVQFGWWW